MGTSPGADVGCGLVRALLMACTALAAYARLYRGGAEAGARRACARACVRACARARVCVCVCVCVCRCRCVCRCVCLCVSVFACVRAACFHPCASVDLRLPALPTVAHTCRGELPSFYACGTEYSNPGVSQAVATTPPRQAWRVRPAADSAPGQRPSLPHLRQAC
jgi:hypothetical protein